MTELTVVIPIKNEAPSLEQLYRELTETLSAWGRSYEIILVDDGSTDDSFAILARLREFLILVGVVGGVVGIIFGVHTSRSLTAPLDRLAAAAQAIGRRDLRQRVALKGSREIVAVATAFNDMAAALEQAESLRRNLVARISEGGAQ